MSHFAICIKLNRQRNDIDVNSRSLYWPCTGAPCAARVVTRSERSMRPLAVCWAAPDLDHPQQVGAGADCSEPKCLGAERCLPTVRTLYAPLHFVVLRKESCFGLELTRQSYRQKFAERSTSGFVIGAPR